MSVRLVIRPQAEREIFEAAEYYEEKRFGLGFEFSNELEKAMKDVAEHPSFYFNTVPEKAQRRFLLTRFPYVIIYEMEDKTGVFWQCVMREEIRFERELAIPLEMFCL